MLPGDDDLFFLVTGEYDLVGLTFVLYDLPKGEGDVYDLESGVNDRGPLFGVPELDLTDGEYDLDSYDLLGVMFSLIDILWALFVFFKMPFVGDRHLSTKGSSEM